MANSTAPKDAALSVMPGLYPGHVMHRRLRPFAHRFDYRVFSLYLDLDQVAETCGALRWLSHNRINLLSFHDRDHGPRDGSPLRPWVDAQLARAGLDRPAKVMLLTFPRVLGYVFNPLSLYYCFDPQGQLSAVIHEVRNTFGELHCYVIPVADPSPPVGRAFEQSCEKGFFVSPFIGMTARYRFRLAVPGQNLRILIRQSTPDGALLVASQSGRRKPLTDRTILQALSRQPLMTWKVIAAIHWQALWLWLKGANFQARPAPPSDPVTVVAPPIHQAS